MTVDWSNYLSLSPAEQAALWAQYRATIQQEIAANKLHARRKPPQDEMAANEKAVRAQDERDG